MYEHVRGTLEQKNPALAVVDVGGVGYRVLIPLTTYERLPAEGAPVRLFTALVVREDALRLYGFATAAERSLFLTLQTVSGIGPAVALGIVSSTSHEAFRDAVLAGDTARLRRIRGVGRRLSERLVVELRDRVADLAAEGAGATPGDAASRDAVLALEALGYPRAAADRAVRGVRAEAPDLAGAGELVRRALTLL